MSKLQLLDRPSFRQYLQSVQPSGYIKASIDLIDKLINYQYNADRDGKLMTGLQILVIDYGDYSMAEQMCQQACERYLDAFNVLLQMCSLIENELHRLSLMEYYTLRYFRHISLSTLCECLSKDLKIAQAVPMLQLILSRHRSLQRQQEVRRNLAQVLAFDANYNRMDLQSKMTILLDRDASYICSFCSKALDISQQMYVEYIFDTGGQPHPGSLFHVKCYDIKMQQDKDRQSQLNRKGYLQ
ncbi:hypothetical protein MP228_005956 [Amoeboaphelidium protococcarum]|nr:hypothetical protein MP228_005956 [Amoeboaphelidium protococcarum]